jgi:hypothetical protein
VLDGREENGDNGALPASDTLFVGSTHPNQKGRHLPSRLEICEPDHEEGGVPNSWSLYNTFPVL